jgi:hypothetical protein
MVMKLSRDGKGVMAPVVACQNIREVIRDAVSLSIRPALDIGVSHHS